MSENKLNFSEISCKSLEKDLKLTEKEQIKIQYDLEEEEEIYSPKCAAYKASGDCYDGAKLWIMNSTPEMLRTIFTAIRTCYSPEDQAYIAYEEYFKYLDRESKNKEFPNDMIRLLTQVAKMRHLSTLEHVNITFGIRCVSRSLLAQMTRHRVGWSFSVQSQRYVKQSKDSKHGGFNYIMPPDFAKDEELTQDYAVFMNFIQQKYDYYIAKGIKPEDARYILPNAATTNITVTCNLRAFLDFYGKRNQLTHSQWEIAFLAERMKEEILKVEPGLEFIFKAYSE